MSNRPPFQSKAHAEWFAKTPKWVLYALLKDHVTVSCFDSAESDEAHNGWLTVAQETQRLLKQAKII
jgi:hypothetical protein